MACNDGLPSAAMLLLALGAIYLLLSERRRTGGAAEAGTVGSWRDTDPSQSRDGFLEPRSSGGALRYERPRDQHDKDPLDFTPDIQAHVRRLQEEVGVRTGNMGAVMEVEWHCRQFAMLVYRRMGRDPEKTSKLDATRAVDELTRIRADLVNAVQSLYVSVYRDRLHAEIDAVTEGLMRDTAAYIRAVRMVVGGAARNAYEGGRGFPSPWNEAADPNYDMLV